MRAGGKALRSGSRSGAFTTAALACQLPEINKLLTPAAQA